MQESAGGASTLSGRRRSLRSVGCLARTIDNLPSPASTTSMRRLRPVSVWPLRSVAHWCCGETPMQVKSPNNTCQSRHRTRRAHTTAANCHRRAEDETARHDKRDGYGRASGLEGLRPGP